MNTDNNFYIVRYEVLGPYLGDVRNCSFNLSTPLTGSKLYDEINKIITDKLVQNPWFNCPILKSDGTIGTPDKGSITFNILNLINLGRDE